MANNEELKLLSKIANNQPSVFSLVRKLFFPQVLETFTIGDSQILGDLLGSEFNIILSYKMGPQSVQDSKPNKKKVGFKGKQIRNCMNIS